jgi:hypothetical protein
MQDIKELYANHKKEIIIGGVLIFIAYKMHIKHVRKQAFRNGSIVGFHGTIDWFEKHFDDINLRKLWEEWVIQNPNKVMYYK